MGEPKFPYVLVDQGMLQNRHKRKIDEVVDSQDRGIGETKGASKIKIQDTEDIASAHGAASPISSSEIENYGWSDDDELLADALAGRDTSSPFGNINDDGDYDESEDEDAGFS